MGRYSDDFRASALVMLEAHGYPENKTALKHIARKLNMPDRTLRRWHRRKHDPDLANIVQRKKIDLRQAIQDELAAIFDEMQDARIDADYRTLGTVAGILFDKMQLLDGRPTAINQTEDWRTKAIDDIKSGNLNYEVLADTFDESIAAELFRAAGVPVQTR